MAIWYTLSTLRQAAKDFLDRQGVGWQDAHTLRFANIANALVYRAVAQVDPWQLAMQEVFAFPASSRRLDLIGALPGGATHPPMTIIGPAGLLDQDAAVDENNQPVPIDVVSMDELQRRYFNPNEIAVSDATGEPLSAYAVAYNEPFLWMAPVPTAARNLQITYIPYWAELTEVGDEKLLTRSQDEMPASHATAVKYHHHVLSLMIGFMRANEVNVDLEKVVQILEADAARSGPSVQPMYMGFEGIDY